VFDKKNYNVWEKAVQKALKAKINLYSSNGTLTKLQPAEDEDFLKYQAWDMTNSMICSWILNVIKPKLQLSIAYAMTA